MKLKTTAQNVKPGDVFERNKVVRAVSVLPNVVIIEYVYPYLDGREILLSHGVRQEGPGVEWNVERI